MVLAGQAVLGGVGEHVAHHAAQRLLGQKIVADVVGCHWFDSQAVTARADSLERMLTRLGVAVSRCGQFRQACVTTPRSVKKVEASVARCLRTPPDGA